MQRREWQGTTFLVFLRREGLPEVEQNEINTIKLKWRQQRSQCGELTEMRPGPDSGGMQASHSFTSPFDGPSTAKGTNKMPYRPGG